MNIYDVTFYGIYYSQNNEPAKLRLFEQADQSEAQFGLLFEISLLQEFQGRKDVLKVDFKDGTCDYLTLYSPVCCYTNIGWKHINNSELSDAFLELFNKVNTQEEEKIKPRNIFDIKFYGIAHCCKYGLVKVDVAINPEELKRESKQRMILTKREFEATVIPELNGREYVVKVEYKDNLDSKLITLFEPLSRCNDRVWRPAMDKGLIQEAIKACYIKYLNS